MSQVIVACPLDKFKLPNQLLPNGFSNRNLRENLAPLLGEQPENLTQGRMTYQLRRLRLHGMIERIPKSHRYCLTDLGLRTAWFFTAPTLVSFDRGWAEYCPNSQLPTDHSAAASIKSTKK